jgi:hypothetical protein
MIDPRIPAEYKSIEAHIRRAHIERSMVMGRMFAYAADALWNGVSRTARAVANGFSAARDARTVEADALLNRLVVR